MKHLFFAILLFATISGNAQTDVIVLEKKGENVKTYAAGVEITMQTIYNQWFSGTIELIRNDSIFINGMPFHYKEIAGIRRERNSINYQTDGSLLMVAGGGVLLLGAVNGLYRHDKASTWYAPASFITAGSFLILGFLIRKSQFKTYHIGKKYSIQYLALSAGKKD